MFPKQTTDIGAKFSNNTFAAIQETGEIEDEDDKSISISISNRSRS